MDLVVVGLFILAVLILGALAIAFTVKLLWFLVIGLVIGLIARAILPGKRRLSLFKTSLAGVVGSLGGGLIADHLFDWGWALQFVSSIAVAAVVLLVFTQRADNN